MPAEYTYDHWLKSLGLPLYTGFFIEDLRTLELEWWEERQCSTAFVKLMGQEGVCEARITEIPPGKTLPPLKMAVDEIVYVIEGNGLASVWAGDQPRKPFEWQKFSMFMLPRHCWSQLSNMQGDKPARLLHYNFLPMAMTTIPDPEFFINNSHESPERLYGKEEFYSQAKITTEETGDRALGIRRILSVCTPRRIRPSRMRVPTSSSPRRPQSAARPPS